MSRKVIRVQTHGTFMVMDLGNIGETLDSNTKGKLNMTLTDAGVQVSADGQGLASGKRVEFVVPLAMCKVIQLALE